MSDVVLEVKNLVKEYGSFRAVDGISFSVKKGKVLGFLGPNGAGKTTTIHMLMGITSPTSGVITYFDKDFVMHRQEVLQRINFTSAFNTLLGRITIWENLLVFAGLYEIKNPEQKIKELIDYFEMKDFLYTRYWDLSSGQKTRVNIIKSLLNDPELILMDEPTASLDPDIADKTLTLIEELKRIRKIAIIYTSHAMDEVTRICDEVIFLDHGKIVAQGTPIGLTKSIEISYLRLLFSTPKEQIEKYLKEQNLSYEFLSNIAVVIKTDEKHIPKILFSMEKEKIYITDIEVKKPTLEDVFLQIARGKHDVSK